MLNLSLRILNSDEVREQILKDIDHLLEMADKEKVKPVILVIGTIFVETGIMRILSEILTPQVIKEELDLNPQDISGIFKVKKLSSYNNYELKSGDFSTEEEKRFKVFFDPDEEYMCLIVADPNQKAKEGDSQTADNHPYYFLKFKPEEVLGNFSSNFIM